MNAEKKLKVIKRPVKSREFCTEPEEKYRLMVENAVAISWENKPAILSFFNDITPRKRLEVQSIPGSEMTTQCLFKTVPLLEKPGSCPFIPSFSLALFLQHLSVI